MTTVARRRPLQETSTGPDGAAVRAGRVGVWVLASRPHHLVHAIDSALWKLSGRLHRQEQPSSVIPGGWSGGHRHLRRHRPRPRGHAGADQLGGRSTDERTAAWHDSPDCCWHCPGSGGCQRLCRLGDQSVAGSGHRCDPAPRVSFTRVWHCLSSPGRVEGPRQGSDFSSPEANRDPARTSFRPSSC